MKTIVYEKYGPPEVLHLKEAEKPIPKENEILIKLCATTVTAGDVRLRKADPFAVRTFNGFFKPQRTVLGFELSGKVESAGKSVRLYKAGDEVFGSAGFDFGAYAEYICVPEDAVIAVKPGNISFEEAAAVSFGGLTSMHFLKKGNTSKGKKVLIYGASGSLGTAAVQIAKSFEADVTGVCSGANTEMVKSLGADRVVDYTKEDFSSGGEKYDIIYDTIGKSPYSKCIKSLKNGGYFLRAVNISPLALLRGALLNLFSSKKVVGGISKELIENLLYLKKLMESGKYKPVIDKIFPLENIAEAHAYVEKGHKKGNVAINIGCN